jgi:apolipoprotein N-acyltransferase
MSTQTASDSVSPLKFSLRIIPACISAGLLFLSLPDPDQGWLAWIALVPLLIACRGLKPLSAVLIGLAFGMMAHAFVFSWIFNVPGFRWYHFGILAFYLGLYPALWCGSLALFRRINVPVVTIGPALWAALDFLRAHAGFLAFPWESLAYTQHQNLPLLQITTLTGEYGVTFLLVMANLIIYELIFTRAWRGALVVLALILGTWSWGFYEMNKTPVPGQTIKVAVVQPSILLSERKTAAGRLASLTRLENLTREVARQKPAFIVWPETALRGFPNEPVQTERVRKLVQTTQIPLILGSSEYEKYSLPDRPYVSAVQFGMRSYNSAYLVLADGTFSAPYRKRLLVPFAEYLPGQPFIKWPSWIVDKSFNITAGEEPGYVSPQKDLKITLIICWENLFPDLVRPLVKNGANIVVQLTNDNHFGRSAAPRQHNIASQLRAIENRTPVVVASNTGPSAIFDAWGRPLATIEHLFTTGIADALISKGQGGTTYSQYGDVFAFLCMLFSLLGSGWMALRNRIAPRTDPWGENHRHKL